MKRTLLIIAFICGILMPAFSQDICFEHIDKRNGLSQNTVQAILQDRDGFLWFGTKDGLNRFDGKHFKTFRHIPGAENGLGNSQIRCLAEDDDGNIWTGTNSGLYIYRPTPGTFEAKIIRDAEGKRSSNIVLAIRRGPDGSMWVSVERLGIYCMKKGETELSRVFESTSPIRTFEVDKSTGAVWFAWSGGGLYCTEDSFGSYSPYLLADGSKVFPEDIISSILFSGYNRIYLGLESNGLVEINRSAKTLKKLNLGKPSPFVRNIMQYSQNELWVGTESGVFIWDIPSGTARHLEYSPQDKWSLSDNAIHSIYKDRDAGIWIGTFFGGINYLPHRFPDFRKFYDNGSDGCLGGRRVRKLCPAGNGNIWVASEDAGLFLFNPETEKFRRLAQSRDFSNIQALLPDGDELWIGTFSKGIKVLNVKTSRIRSFEFVKEPGPRLFSNNIFALAKSSDGLIWVGTMHGLQYYDRATGGFGYVPEINGGKMVNDILEDTKGNLWVGTLSNGLYLRRSDSGKWEQFISGQDPAGIPGNTVNCIFEDSKGNLWISVYGCGICRWNPDNNGFTTINSRNGLPGDVVHQIAEDDAGYMWLSSNDGLVLISPESYAVEKIFTIDDGLLNNQFNGNSFCQDRDGNMYFGCTEGLVSFNPMELRWKTASKKISGICVTEFAISGKDVGNVPTGKEISDTESLKLKYDQNTFSLRISSLTFSENVRMDFRMRGYDNLWRDWDGGMITYTNVPPGEYVFCARLKDHPETVKNLHILITPPWWKSVPANAFYILLCTCLLAAGIRLIYKRQSSKRDKYIKAFELAKEKEVYDTKIAFFTNITHEIRTPLTLIKGPLDNILSKGNTDAATIRDLNIMKRNTDRLLSLVNQLLDFQKIEKENLQLELSVENIPELLEETVERFSDAMAYKGRECRLDIVERDIFAMVNRESLTKIISNLLTNAMKYSSSRIDILLRKDGGDFLLSVGNDGPVVPLDKRTEIFSQFYRYSNANGQSGTGIGLYLSKSLAELQKGRLAMTDDPDVNEFVLRMPLYSGAVPAVGRETPEQESGVSGLSVNGTEVPMVTGMENTLILIVEDDPEMCGFIGDTLGEKWKTVSAGNGKEALKILEKENVSIIVSDVMMPQMDGIELCRTVRSDIRFTHIPLVLLTAKTTLESKIEGMNVGADAYIEKPFSLPYLVSVIANLLKKRQRIKETFLKNPLASISPADIAPSDTEFLKRMQDVVSENLNNPKFRMDDIAEMLNMSRANFYRKISGVLDISPNDYLKMERLRKAAKLLVERDLSISEVSYMVGFGSPSYFAKCFHSQFGIQPKDFVGSLRHNDKE